MLDSVSLASTESSQWFTYSGLKYVICSSGAKVGHPGEHVHCRAGDGNSAEGVACQCESIATRIRILSDIAKIFLYLFRRTAIHEIEFRVCADNEETVLEPIWKRN